MSSQSLTCPNCGAALDYDGKSSVVRCGFCGASVVVPEALRPKAPERDPQLPDPSLTEVAELFRAGKRVRATIRYREITGAGLKQAQQALDIFAQGGPLQRPNLLGG